MEQWKDIVSFFYGEFSIFLQFVVLKVWGVRAIQMKPMSTWLESSPKNQKQNYFVVRSSFLGKFYCEKLIEEMEAYTMESFYYRNIMQSFTLVYLEVVN